MISAAFMPIPTAVLGRWLGSSSQQDQIVASVFYGAFATLGLILFNVIWWYGAYVGKLTHGEFSATARVAHTIAWSSSIPVLAILTAIGFVSPAIAVGGFVAVIVVYVLPLAAVIARAGNLLTPAHWRRASKPK